MIEKLAVLVGHVAYETKAFAAAKLNRPPRPSRDALRAADRS
jgi:hypothetical protein